MASEREKLIAASCAHAAQLAVLAVQKRVTPSAIPDFMRRGFAVFAEQNQAMESLSPAGVRAFLVMQVSPGRIMDLIEALVDEKTLPRRSAGPIPSAANSSKQPL